MTTTTNALDGYCGRIARTFARKAGITVRFEGEGAKTDGSTIWLPANAEEIAKDPDGRRQIDGLLDHEWLHLYFDREDSQAGRESLLTLNHKFSVAGDRRRAMLLNIWDDVRIEQCAPYEGVRENLRAMNLDIVDTLRTYPESHTESFHNFGKGLILRARGEDASWLHPAVVERLDAMGDLYDLARRAETSDDVAELVEETMRRLGAYEAEQERESEPEPEPEPEPGEGEWVESDEPGEPGEGEPQPPSDPGFTDDDDEPEPEPGDGDDDDGDEDDEDSTESDASEGEGSEGHDDDDEGEGDDSGSEGDEGEGDDTEGESSDDDGSGDSAESHDDGTGTESAGDGEHVEDREPSFGEDEEVPEDIVKDESERGVTDTAAKTQAAKPRHIAPPEVLARDRVRIEPSADNPAHTRFKNAITGKAGALKNKLVTALLARRTCYVQGDKERGRLDNRALASVRLGNRRVFSQRVEGDTTATAVSLLIDCSGSMGEGRGSKMYLAAQAAYKLGEALDALGVEFNIWGFQNDFGSRYHGYARGGFYNRFAPYLFRQLKDFGERWSRCAARLPHMAHTGGEDNDDGGALRWVARKLLERDADRHILIVLSDGSPASAAADRRLMRDDLHDAVREVSAAGIELVGLGINDTSVRTFYPDHAVIRNVDELPAELMKALKATMMKAAKRPKRSKRRA